MYGRKILVIFLSLLDKINYRTDSEHIQKVSFEGLVQLNRRIGTSRKEISIYNGRLTTVVGRISYENKMDMSILMQK